MDGPNHPTRYHIVPVGVIELFLVTEVIFLKLLMIPRATFLQGSLKNSGTVIGASRSVRGRHVRANSRILTSMAISI